MDPFDQVVARDLVVLALEITQVRCWVLEAVQTTPTVLERIINTMKTYEHDVLGEVSWQP